MTIELRCEAKLHGVVLEGDLDGVVLEVACDSRFCGAGKGIVVRHRFRQAKGELKFSTQRYKSPERRQDVPSSGTNPAVRSA